MFKFDRKRALYLANMVVGNDLVYKSIGKTNRDGWLHTVFVAYPDAEKYAAKYVELRHRHLMSWRPWPVGVFEQNGKYGVMFVISNTPDQFSDESSVENLTSLERRTENIRLMLGAKQKTFAGVIPGFMMRKGIIDHSVEAAVTVSAVTKAFYQLEAQLGYNNCRVIILGGRGFIGRGVTERILDRQVYSVDIGDEWPSHLTGKKTILIDITAKMALSEYVHRFWPELVVLNEVYPAPNKYVVAILTEMGVRLFHVVGVKAKMFPKMPGEYEGAAPCCAGWDSPDMNVVLKALNNVSTAIVPSVETQSSLAETLKTEVGSESQIILKAA